MTLFQHSVLRNFLQNQDDSEALQPDSRTEEPF